MTLRQFDSICVYCGSADHLHEDYLLSAREMGALLARNHIRIVYGGGKTGLMGALANGCLEAGGMVIGVVPKNLFTDNLIHQNLTQTEVLPDIQQRKARMSELADAFIALPGGFGTFDELFETLTWAQIGLHNKPIGLLNVRNYFDPLLRLVDNALREGFIYAEHKVLMVHDPSPAGLLKQLNDFCVPEGLERWVTRSNQ
jgi:hypothetical protein